MGRFFKSPGKYWDEDEEGAGDDAFFASEAEDGEDGSDDQDEEEMLDAIRRGEYKPKKSDPWTWHVLYATSRDLEALSKNTYDLSSKRSKQAGDPK
jgi:hypothetical protein